MIDERLLADPARCPACAAVLRDRVACPACALPLTGPAATRLWQVSVQVSQLLAERARLVAALRTESGIPAYAPAPAAQVPPAGAGVGGPTVPAPRPEWTPRRVQNLLLALGVGLLAVAAVIFVVVSWGSLGVGGRAAVMTGITALAAVGTHQAARRGLTSTAEAVSLLTVGLALLDCAGAWASDLAGLRSVPGPVAAAGASALVAGLAAAGSLAVRTRALRLSAAGLAQLPVLLVAGHLARTSDHPAALLAAAAALQAVASLAAAAWWPGRADTADARLLVGVGAGLSGVAATGLGLLAAYAEDGSVVVGAALLLVVAAVLVVAGELTRGGAAVTRGLDGLAAAVLVAAVWAPVADATPSRWLPPALALAALALLAGSGLVPVARRTAPAAVALAAALLPAVAAVPALLATALGRLQWLEDTWSGQAGRAGDLLVLTGPGSGRVVGDAVPESAVGPAAAVLLVAATALALAPLVRTALRALVPGLPVALAGAGVLAVPAAGGSYAGGLTADLALALVGLVGGVVLLRRGQVRVAVAAAGSGALVLALVVSWSFAVDTATLTVLPLAAAVLVAAVTAAAGLARLLTLRVVATALAAMLVVAEAAAVTRFSGAGWPAVAAVAASMLVLVAAAALALVVARAAADDPFWRDVRAVVVVTGTVAVLADTAAVAWWQGAEVAVVGLAVSVAAAVLLAAATLPVPQRVVPSMADVRTVAALGGLVGVAGAGADGDRLWLALLAVGWRRRGADPTYRSWNAYAPGLALALGPSLLRAVTDAGATRPLLLGLAALMVLAVGVARRLQAPLVIGGGVLLVDAVVQLAPYLAAVYEAVPRWVSIGAAGLLLLGAGATYEQRVRDLRRVGRRMASLG